MTHRCDWKTSTKPKANIEIASLTIHLLGCFPEYYSFWKGHNFYDEVVIEFNFWSICDRKTLPSEMPFSLSSTLQYYSFLWNFTMNLAFSNKIEAHTHKSHEETIRGWAMWLSNSIKIFHYDINNIIQLPTQTPMNNMTMHVYQFYFQQLWSLSLSYYLRDYWNIIWIFLIAKVLADIYIRLSSHTLINENDSFL